MLRVEFSDGGDNSIQTDDDGVKDVSMSDDDIMNVIDADQGRVSFPKINYSTRSGRKWSHIPHASSTTPGINDLVLIKESHWQ